MEQIENKTLFYFNSNINEETPKRILETLQKYPDRKEMEEKGDSDDRILWINSLGGASIDFLSVLNLFKRYFKIVLGGPTLESLAFLIWLSFPIERRYVLDNTLALFHHGSAGSGGHSDKYNLGFVCKKLKKEDEYFNKIMQKNLRVSSEKEVEDMALRESSFDCYDLKEYGLLDTDEDDSQSNIIQKECILESKLVIL